jgi:hypothetical protein
VAEASYSVKGLDNGLEKPLFRPSKGSRYKRTSPSSKIPLGSAHINEYCQSNRDRHTSAIAPATATGTCKKQSC